MLCVCVLVGLTSSLPPCFIDPTKYNMEDRLDQRNREQFSLLRHRAERESQGLVSYLRTYLDTDSLPDTVY